MAVLGTTPYDFNAQCRQVNEVVSGNKHRERAYWVHIGGAEHPETTAIDGSPTPVDVDFYAVRQRNSLEALAGGAACKEPTPPEQLEGCERVPVIYATAEDVPWHQAYRSEDPGYVGAVAWIGRGEAIAVGGTGEYPRREPTAKGANKSYEDRLAEDADKGAGDARAWHLHDGAWEEISDELPEEMGGLSALDIWIGREFDGDEWGLAGDYGHIWEWEGGQFTGSHIDREAPAIGAPDPEWAVVNGPADYQDQQTCQGSGPAETCRWDPNAAAGTSDAGFFDYRVREIRIAPDRQQKRAFAFTSGCCASADAPAGSVLLEYVPQPKRDATGVIPPEAPDLNDRPRWLVHSDDYGDSVYSFAIKPDRHLNFAGDSFDAWGDPRPRHNEITWQVAGPGQTPEQRVVSPADPDPADETGARFVASDGDGEPTPATSDLSPMVVGNGIPDWKIGEALASDPQQRGLGMIATTVDAYKAQYGGLRPYCTFTPYGQFNAGQVPYYNTGGEVNTDGSNGAEGVQNNTGVCRHEQLQVGQTPAFDEDGPLRTRESGIQLGPTWRLNGIDLLDAGNTGYAVGDRGAIMRFGEAAVESDPPSLGARRPAPLSDGSAYDGTRPPPVAEAGEVAALASQRRERHDEPQLFRAGSPNGSELDPERPVEGVRNIVMSRDGSEGWAVGNRRGLEGQDSGRSPTTAIDVMTLYHYQAGAWTRCDPVGIPGIEAADDECAELASVSTKPPEPGIGRITIEAAARIPYENDSDPTNDDEFEVLAVGSYLEVENGRVPTVYRYREGRWRLEDLEVRRSLIEAYPGEGQQGQTSGDLDIGGATSMACLGPDECWLATQGTEYTLKRFDGSRWLDCTRQRTPQGNGDPYPNRRGPCGDAATRIAGMSFRTGEGEVSVASAGDRVYLAGSRLGSQALASVGSTGNADDAGATMGAPLILHKDYGSEEQWQTSYDPQQDDPRALPGVPRAVSVARRADGRYEGWAAGSFEMPTVSADKGLGAWPMLRLDPESGEWDVWRVRDATFDHLKDPGGTTSVAGPGGQGVPPHGLVTLPGTGSEAGRSYLGKQFYTGGVGMPAHMLTFNPRRERWELAEQPGTGLVGQVTKPVALALDGRGGIWSAFETEIRSDADGGHAEVYFYNYTKTPPREVFEEAAHPLADGESLRDLAGAADGSVWLATDRGALYRRDRLTGWERTSIPGWAPGRVVTRWPIVEALAVAPDGTGVAVGEDGRIADLSASNVVLNAAAGTVCRENVPAPCGTSFDLVAASVAPDHSAMVGGEGLALLARSRDGAFSRIAPPDASTFATIVGIAMPTANTAWLALDTGQIFAGTGGGTSWRWRLENTTEINGVDRLVSEDKFGEPITLRDIAVDEAGHGFAVGDRGMVLERTGEPGQAWKRADSGVTERLTAVSLSAGRGPGALAGGDRGLVLTHVDGDWHLARPGDRTRPDNGFVVGTALLPGLEDGQVEAWAGTAPARDVFDFEVRRDMTQLLHHTDAPEEPLLDPSAGVEPLRDVPPPRDGELSFAALGRSDCQLLADDPDGLMTCPPLRNGTELEQVILRRARDELLQRSRQPGGPDFAVFTGDAYDIGGSTGGEAVEQNSRLAANGINYAAAFPIPYTTGGEKYRRFNEQLTDWLPDHGLPVFAPIGARDLTEARACAVVVPGVPITVVCANNRDRARVGENLAWRQAMEHQPAPWGDGPPAQTDELFFEPLGDSAQAVRAQDSEVDDPTDAVEETEIPETSVPEQDLPEQLGQLDKTLPKKTPRVRAGGTVGGREEAGDRPVPIGGASTHYAIDIKRGDDRVARLIVVDTSIGSLAASDPIQQPLEPDGGQAAWLERVLCVKGSVTDTGECTREADQQAIVVSNTPSYSYGPTNPAETQADAAVFESILFRHRVNVVVAGKLGWNGRYWALAPGVHQPCLGGGYAPDYAAPEPAGQVCDRSTDNPGADPSKLVNEAQATASGLTGETGGTGVIPFVVASGAGGRFDEFAEKGGQAAASSGFWRGYSIVRLDPSGDPRRTVVEQRPIFDWIAMRGRVHALRANKKLALEGIGREPIGALTGFQGSPRFDRIDSPAISHCYDLLAGDPERPWAPLQAEDATQAQLDTAGPGCKAREPLGGEAASTSSAAAQSNGCEPYVCLDPRVATMDDQSGAVKAGNGNYPRTYAVALLSVGARSATYPLVFEPRASFRAPAPPPPIPVAVPAPPPPPAAAPPTTPQVNLPSAPVLPVLTAHARAPPPIPPSPPTFASQAPLDLNLSPAALDVSPPTAVSQPPTPPVNPAPPGGARKEARQRQAAAQKSGADSGDEGVSEAREQGGDLADGPQSPDLSAATRRDHAFTALSSRDQPSAWARDALLGGGLGIAALILALGLSRARPTPRTRPPEAPAPAWSRARWRP